MKICKGLAKLKTLLTLKTSKNKMHFPLKDTIYEHQMRVKIASGLKRDHKTREDVSFYLKNYADYRYNHMPSQVTT